MLGDGVVDNQILYIVSGLSSVLKKACPKAGAECSNVLPLDEVEVAKIESQFRQ